MTPSEQLSLVPPFSEDELKQVVFDSDPNGALGPDGFSYKFYQYFWDLLKGDLLVMCHQFHFLQLNLFHLNKAVVCLIPKTHEATHLKQYRPISLVNCSFKLLSKMLTKRLDPIMTRIIDITQSVFLPGRYILDNVLLSQEIIHHAVDTQQPGVIIKIDFEKTYDKINWSYILKVLTCRHFPAKWVTWIKMWLTSSQTSIYVNNQMTPYFKCQRGVRQGDPLAPFLYILVADTLSKMFTKCRQQNLIVGIGPPCHNNLVVTNCHYADDTILFLSATLENIERTSWVMKSFEALSGIRINFSKTELFSLHTSAEFTQAAAQLFGCQIGKFPLKYLGLPLHNRKLALKDWNFLITKLEHKLQNWKDQLLSIGGRLTLLNSALSSVPLYALSLFRIPITILQKVDILRRKFLWQGYGNNKKNYALLNWPTLCIPKKQGGLGILNLDHMNIALLTK